MSKDAVTFDEITLERRNALLQEAKDLITPREQWTRGALARDEKRNEIEPNDPDAVCWCLGGALGKVVSDCYDQAYADLTGNKDTWDLRDAHERVLCNAVADAILKMMPDVKEREDINGVATFNDCKKISHSQVLSILDDAKGLPLTVEQFTRTNPQTLHLFMKTPSISSTQ